VAKDRFDNLDLNLLKVFQTLMQERNMRKASALLHVSQPAISQSLQKLRFHFADDLFVKVTHGLEPTPFALELSASITPHFDALKSAVNSHQQFDPSKIDYPIRIALVATVQTLLAGPLFRIVREQAPNATLELLPWASQTFEEIQYGRTLFGVTIDKEAPKELCDNFLMPLTGRFIVRVDHPIKEAIVKPGRFEGVELASFVTPGWNDHFSYAQEVLKGFGVNTNVSFRSEVLDTVIDVVSQSDLILAHSTMFPIERYPNLRFIDLDIPIRQKQLDIHSYHHIKDRNNPIINWLNSAILEVLKQQSDKH
jgi:DNA-binding transcriptional LysR family regulator